MNDKINGDIALLAEAAAKTRGMIRDKTEDRDVECEMVTDYIHGEVRVKRLDTGEVFSRRTMLPNEAQLPLTAGGKKVSDVTDHKNNVEDECDDSDEVKDPLKAKLIEVAATNKDKKPAKKKRAKKNASGDEVDVAPPEGCDF